MTGALLGNIASLVAPEGGHDGVLDAMSNDMIKDSGVGLRGLFICTNLSNALLLGV